MTEVHARRCIAVLASVVVPLLGGCAQPVQPERQSAPGRLAAALASQPIVLLGEVHDNREQHALRALALRRHLAGGARPALLMEQFDRERQAALDGALAAADATADSVIEAGAAGAPGVPGAPGAAATGSGWNWHLYRPYIALAVEYRLRIVAANVSRADARRVMTDGLAALGFDPAVPADVAAAQAQAIVAGHCGAIDLAAARPLVAAQVARDQFMARALQSHAREGAVLLAGNGHVRRDIGVPRWLKPALRERSVSIGLIEAGSGPAPAYDIAIATPAQPRPDPCAAFAGPAPVRP